MTLHRQDIREKLENPHSGNMSSLKPRSVKLEKMFCTRLVCTSIDEAFTVKVLAGRMVPPNAEVM